jgi:hypothetical protein
LSSFYPPDPIVFDGVQADAPSVRLVADLDREDSVRNLRARTTFDPVYRIRYRIIARRKRGTG